MHILDYYEPKFKKPEGVTEAIINKVHRFETALYIALAYYRSFASGNQAMKLKYKNFERKAESFITLYEMPNSPEFDLLDKKTDEIFPYVESLSGSDEYHFRLMVSVASSYFEEYKNVMFQNARAITKEEWEKRIKRAINRQAKRKMEKQMKQDISNAGLGLSTFSRMMQKISLDLPEQIKSVRRYMDNNIIVELEPEV
ncbi:hypothetical protein V6R21_32350 [Limibacter armeniacum]|uniref:hypothetical protein n=1 Tax=Limibacter armeniacum TaxID=466084 RepID=UPI002FE5DF3B